ncbi:MAG: ABC transporter ATP-binding protein [Gemmatimonadales bacterium]
MTAVLECAALRKEFVGGDGQPIEVLTDVSLTVERGEFIAIVGESGAGKSTLLHLLGALDRPTAGEIRLTGNSYGDLNGDQLSMVRNSQVGFVFQFHHLLREFSAVENVMMPLLIGGASPSEARGRATVLLDRVELSERLEHRPGQLSGGEQQRVALARAIVNDPAVILADEPSGNLDHRNSERLHQLLQTLIEEMGTSLVVVTHDRHLAGKADRILAIEDGMLVPLAGVEAMLR